MTRNLFSVPIFFIVFRETLEAAIITCVLLGLVEQIVHEDSSKLSAVTTQTRAGDEKVDSASSDANNNSVEPDTGDNTVQKRRLVRKLRIQARPLMFIDHLACTKSSHQIFLGAAIGLFISLAIGGAFLAIWFTQASNLWAKSDALWEGLCLPSRRCNLCNCLIMCSLQVSLSLSQPS